jgi:FecR protein
MGTFSFVLAGGSLAATLLAACLTAQSAAADSKVGVAAAVQPEATSQPPGGETTTLKIGKSVVYNERIDTSSSGVVQVLLLDGSTFTVGPNSSLVIDKFVYNPKTGTGTLAASFSKGALRFVGGKLSKNEPGVKVNTPAGALTVHGGVFQGIVDGPNRALFAFVYGKHLSLRRGGRTSVLRSASTVFAINGSGPAKTRDMVQGDADLILAVLTGKMTKLATGKSAKGKPWPYYYGISPTGPYPDQPFIKELYYDGATTQILLSGAKPVPVPVPEPPRPPHYPNYPLPNLTVGPNGPR